MILRLPLPPCQIHLADIPQEHRSDDNSSHSKPLLLPSPPPTPPQAPPAPQLGSSLKAHDFPFLSGIQQHFLPLGTCSRNSSAWKSLLPIPNCQKLSTHPWRPSSHYSQPGPKGIQVWSVRIDLFWLTVGIWVTESFGFSPSLSPCSGPCSLMTARMSYPCPPGSPSLSQWPRLSFLVQYLRDHVYFKGCGAYKVELFWWPVREDSCPGLSSEHSHWLCFSGSFSRKNEKRTVSQKQLKCPKSHQNPASLMLLKVVTGNWVRINIGEEGIESNVERTLNHLVLSMRDNRWSEDSTIIYTEIPQWPYFLSNTPSTQCDKNKNKIKTFFWLVNVCEKSSKGRKCSYTFNELRFLKLIWSCKIRMAQKNLLLGLWLLIIEPVPYLLVGLSLWSRKRLSTRGSQTGFRRNQSEFSQIQGSCWGEKWSNKSKLESGAFLSMILQISTQRFFSWHVTSDFHLKKISSVKIKVIKHGLGFLLPFKQLIHILLVPWKTSSKAVRSIKQKPAGKKSLEMINVFSCQQLEFFCSVTVLACWQHDLMAWLFHGLTWQPQKIP